jgi:hypothetical protein
MGLVVPLITGAHRNGLLLRPIRSKLDSEGE